MKKELIESVAKEICDVAKLEPIDRHGAITEIFSGICLLDAIHILLEAFDKMNAMDAENLGGYFFEDDCESNQVFHNQAIASGFKRRLLHSQSSPDGTCDGIKLFLHHVTSDECLTAESLCRTAFLLCDSPHVRKLMKSHLAAAIDCDSISSIVEA